MPMLLVFFKYLLLAIRWRVVGRLLPGASLTIQSDSHLPTSPAGT